MNESKRRARRPLLQLQLHQPNHCPDPRSPSRRAAVIAIAGAALVATASPAQTASYPTRPITIVVPYTPGSATDILGRLMALELSKELGQPVIVDNKPGVGGSLGTAFVAHSKNDGYTLIVAANGPMAINSTLYKNLSYDPVKDLTPIALLVTSPSLLLVSAQGPDKTVQELMSRMAKRQAGNCIQFGSAGIGTPQHLSAALFAKTANACADHVPYRGPSDNLMAVATGQVAYSFANLPSAIALVKDGRLRALGVTSSQPSPLLPEVPTLASAGLNDFGRTELWFGIAAARDTPAAVTNTLHAAFTKIMTKPEVRASLAAAGFDIPPSSSPADFAQFIREQVKFWGDLVRESGATAT